ncbi:hypothetical protein CPC16_003960 [Podila verticillata]|nr:hypothetical protein CPC16_003960 [Podila verticillata]
MKSLLASMVGNHASTTSSPPSIASSMKTVTKSDPLRKPASCAKTQELAQKQKEPEKVVSSIQPNARGQTTFKPKKKNAAEALAMMAGAIGEGASAFGTAEAICDDSESDNFIKQAMHQLTHEGHPVPQSDESRSASDALSGSENDSSILNRKSAVLMHQRDVAQEEQVPKHEQDQVESAFEESEPTFLFEEDLEEEGILKSPTNVMVGPSPLDDQDSYLFEDQDRPHNSYFQDWIQYMDRKGAAALTIVLATLVRLDPSTWTGPQVAIAFTFATFLAFVLLALYISYKMHHRRERLKNGDTSSSSSLGFFHYLTRGVFASHRHQRHTFAALSPFSKETSTYFTLPTYRDTKSPNVAPEPSYATTSASVAGANRSEIRRTSVARQLSITQAQAVQHAQSSI